MGKLINAMLQFYDRYLIDACSTVTKYHIFGHFDLQYYLVLNKVIISSFSHGIFFKIKMFSSLNLTITFVTYIFYTGRTSLQKYCNFIFTKIEPMSPILI